MLPAIVQHSKGTCDRSLCVQVAADGEIVWVFPSGFEATIAAKSWRLRAEPALKGEPCAGQCCLP